MRTVLPPEIVAEQVQQLPQAPAEPVAAYTVKTFCARYAVGKTLTFEMIADGRLRAVRCAGRVLILSEDAKAWAASLPPVRITRPRG